MCCLCPFFFFKGKEGLLSTGRRRWNQYELCSWVVCRSEWPFALFSFQAQVSLNMAFISRGVSSTFQNTVVRSVGNYESNNFILQQCLWESFLGAPWVFPKNLHPCVGGISWCLSFLFPLSSCVHASPLLGSARPAYRTCRHWLGPATPACFSFQIPRFFTCKISLWEYF